VESDPIGLKGDLNTYAYARSTPTMRVDSRGLLSTVDAQLWRHWRFGDGTYLDISSACGSYLGDNQVQMALQIIKSKAEKRAIEIAATLAEGQSQDFSVSNQMSLYTGDVFGSGIYSFGQGNFHSQAANCKITRGCGKCSSLSCQLGVAARDRFTDPYDIGSDLAGAPFWFGLKCQAGAFNKQICVQ
jgi:uncharacterized protein RhaS with RHS repeats